MKLRKEIPTDLRGKQYKAWLELVEKDSSESAQAILVELARAENAEKGTKRKAIKVVIVDDGLLVGGSESDSDDRAAKKKKSAKCKKQEALVCPVAPGGGAGSSTDVVVDIVEKPPVDVDVPDETIHDHPLIPGTAILEDPVPAPPQAVAGRAKAKVRPTRKSAPAPQEKGPLPEVGHLDKILGQRIIKHHGSERNAPRLQIYCNNKLHKGCTKRRSVREWEQKLGFYAPEYFLAAWLLESERPETETYKHSSWAPNFEQTMAIKSKNTLGV